MTARNHTPPAETGLSLIEVLVALVILLIGLLGLAGLMVQSQRSEMESYQRVQALTLLQDMAGRINANRKAALCYPFSGATVAAVSAPTPWLGTLPTLTMPVTATSLPCTPANILAIYPNMPTAAVASSVATAVNDLNAWHRALLGAAETVGGTAQVGAMVGARGCIHYDPGQQLTDPITLAPILGSGVYRISIAWQGMGDTSANPALLCGQNQYGAETRRRVVSITLRIANLK